MKVNILYLDSGFKYPDWEYGDSFSCRGDINSLVHFLQEHTDSYLADAWLIWDPYFGSPDLNLLSTLLDQKVDVWHSGLTMGMAGKPEFLINVAPSWMYSVDADPSIASISWRLNLRCCLIKTKVLMELGLPSNNYDSLEAAGLELGFRYIKRGALLRHNPNFTDLKKTIKVQLSFKDQIRFVFDCYGRKWANWVLLQKFFGHPFKIISSLSMLKNWGDQDQWQNKPPEIPSAKNVADISVILPTLKRYDYLPSCLESLRNQSLAVKEIICVDQNIEGEQRPDIYKDYPDLPIKVIWQNARGQSTARNQALVAAQGEWIFFADDDSIYPSDALQKHWDLVNYYCADASTGVSVPPREYKIPKDYLDVRIAHNLDTGNCLIRKSTVVKAGGFDLNFDFGKGADLDLGMRIYKNGGVIIHNPYVQRIHFKAQGGLREFGVLWDNRSIDRKSPQPPATISYYFLRHFPKTLAYRAIFRMILLSNLPSSQVVDDRESQVRKVLLAKILKFPFAIPRVIKSIKVAHKMLKTGPKLLAL